MGGQPCRLKALMNGLTIEQEVADLRMRLDGEDVQITDEAGYEIVECFNQMEDLAFKAKRIFLESQGYKGPWPKSMREKGDKSEYLTPRSE